tara:strand:+ start:677862 stop:678797 length:936 start_codon:yes stop_codon:yes gene_type:complete
LKKSEIRMVEYYSHGKLLLTAEYAVLDGAKCLAVPTKLGQSLRVSPLKKSLIDWKSFDHQGNLWFEKEITIEKLRESEISKEENPVLHTLLKLLREAIKLNPEFLSEEKGYRVETYLEFQRDWGLGSSSTLINNIASWAGVDAFQLLWNGFSGSGYDIACAQNDGAITYSIDRNKPLIEKVDFNPPFSENIYLVYLERKQNSRDGIARYKKLKSGKASMLKRITELTEEIIDCRELHQFEDLITEHEDIIAKAIDMPKVKNKLFNDYTDGCIKSLGAWGGDFILATGDAGTPNYFKTKGFNTVLPYQQMVL